MRVIADHKEWMAAVLNVERHSFFWRLEWFSLFEGESRLLVSETGLAVPVLVRNKLFTKVIHSGPMGGYGGPITPNGSVDLHELGLFLSSIMRRYLASRIVFNGTPWLSFHGTPPWFVRMTRGETMILHPIPSDPLGRCNSSCRRNYRKAYRSGVRVKIGSSSDVEEYTRMYADTTKRHGGAMTYSIDFFQHLIALKNVHLLLATYQGRPIAGIWLLEGKGELFYWHGASYTKWLHLRPNNLLHVEAIELANRLGSEWYNMGASLGKEGLKRFKASFGATEWSYPILTISLVPEFLLR